MNCISEGWGGKRIADRLNRQDIASPQGKSWSQRQVEVLYQNEVYTGRGVGNRTSSGIYHQRQHATPKKTSVDPSVRATAKTLPVQLRPQDEWFVIEHPLLNDLLGDEQLRDLAVAGQDRYWRHQSDPDRPKLSKSKHKASDYLLTGMLRAKQDGGPLVGVLCGRVGKKTRYYRHRRGRTGYQNGSIFNKLIRADAVEKAVLDAVRSTLLDIPNLRDTSEKMISTESNPKPTVDLDDLQRQRDRLKTRTQLILRCIDEDLFDDAQAELDRLKAERRTLDAQIAAAQTATQPSTADVDAIIESTVRAIENFFETRHALPNHLICDWL